MSDQFTLDISDWVQKVKDRADEIVRRIAIELLRRIVLKSPVGNPELWASGYAPPGYTGGRFRANWFVSVGSPNTSTTAAIDKDGNATIEAGLAVVAAVKAGQDIFISNSLPYAHRLEWESWSKQAPAGMVRVTIAELQQIVDQAVRDLSTE